MHYFWTIHSKLYDFEYFSVMPAIPMVSVTQHRSMTPLLDVYARRQGKSLFSSCHTSVFQYRSLGLLVSKCINPEMYVTLSPTLTIQVSPEPRLRRVPLQNNGTFYGQLNG